MTDQPTARPEKPLTPNRRDILRAAASAALSPKSLATMAVKAITEANPYPWITNPGVLNALVQLDKINASGPPSEFKQPGVLKKYILGIDTPQMEKLDEKHTLFADPFWKLLDGKRDKQSLKTALEKARHILRAEEKLEPRRQQLVAHITKLAGEEPWLLRFEPEMRDMLKEAIATGNYKVTPLESWFPELQNGVRVLGDYLQAYMKGELRRFSVKEAIQKSNETGKHYRGSSTYKKLQGDDYIPVAEEKEHPEKTLNHFLNCATRIESNLNTGPVAYRAIIHARSDVRDHIKQFIDELFPRDSHARRLMRGSETHYPPLQDMPMAYNIPEKSGFLTISDPPAALMDMIENAKKAKATGVVR